jgi:hypothetical protein
MSAIGHQSLHRFPVTKKTRPQQTCGKGAFVAGLRYIRNNRAIIPNYGERRRCGEPISTGFVESTVNVVVDKRFAKKQQMQWSRTGAHRLVQVRTRTLDGTLRSLFTKWYPGMAANDSPTPVAAIAA